MSNIIPKDSKIYIAGHTGMVGSSCWKTLKNYGYNNLIGKRSKELDLRDQNQVEKFIENVKPSIIIDAAARVGGIHANHSYPYDFLIDNMLIQNNLISSAHKFEVKKFIFLGSSCIYPKFSKQPIKEEYLLTDTLEPTNQWYAVAKISGLKLIESLRIQFNRDYVSLMPTNLYGPNDNYDLNNSHVLPAMIRKFHEAKVNNAKAVTLWGSGSPMREFLHVDDLSEAILFILNSDTKDSIYNVGSGSDLSIKKLSEIVKKVVGFDGDIIWDRTKPDGTPRKLMDSSKIKNLGWNQKIDLEFGIKDTYKNFLKIYETL